MKKILMFLVLIAGVLVVNAQTYKTRDGKLTFNPNKNQGNKEYSAESTQASALFNVDKSEVALLVPMKTFHFNNALLEEHFNENYLHTDKYPNAKYSGKLIGFDKAMLAKDGEYKISSEGKIELHGASQPFKAPVTMIVKAGTVTFKCTFTIKAENYNIEIPALVKPKLMDETPIAATISFKMN